MSCAARLSRQAVFIDAGIPDLRSFVAGLPAALEPVLIPSQANGVAAMLAWLQGRERYDALHLVGHGRPGQQQLGTTTLNAAAVQGLLADSLRELGQHLSADADLLLYGCETAAGKSGAALLRELARITGAAVAGSTTVTGQGGDWDLDQRVGAVQADVMALPEWQGQLALPLNVETPSPQLATIDDADNLYFPTYAVKGMYSDVDIDAIPSFAIAYYDSFERVTLGVDDRATLAQAGVDGATIGYQFAASGGINDGYYAIVTSTNALDVPSYYEQSGEVTAPDGNNLMIVNGTGGIPFYESPSFDFIAPGTKYTISFNFRDSGTGPNNPNMKLEVLSSSGTALGTLSSGELTVAGQWFTYYTTFTASEDANLRLKVSSVAPSGSGNDFFVDNFRVVLAEIAPPLSIANVTVNEGSQHVVFSVVTVEGLGLTLKLTDGTADSGNTPETDYTSKLEYFDGSQWQPFIQGQLTPTDGDSRQLEGITLLVRVPLKNNPELEGPQQFTLEANYTEQEFIKPNSAIGTATIVDDGTGSYWIDDATKPATPQELSDEGIYLDDDRLLSVNNVRVNEGSQHAVFTIGGFEGQYVKLDLAPGNAKIGQDTGSKLEYWDGRGWKVYTSDSYVQIPSTGEENRTEPANLLVRVALTEDKNHEGPESFLLIASNTGGTDFSGIGTIVDDGSGDIFSTITSDDGVFLNPSSGLFEPQILTPAQATRDDDRPLEVNGTSVGEASPYIYWSVTGEAGQITTLDVSSGTGLVGVDTAPAAALQVFDGTNWVAYTAAVALPSSGELQVRLAVVPDLRVELSETLTLTASNTAGTGFSGESTILDEGPIIPAGETPLSIVGTTVNEGSPYLLYTISGVAGQTAQLELADGSGTAGVDTGSTLEVFNGTTWVSYDSQNPPQLIVTSGTAAQLLVRVAVSNDDIYESPETIVLKATSQGGLTSSGTGTITDDGTGAIFLGNNNTSTPNKAGDTDPDGPDYPAQLDNDKLITNAAPTVNSITVNEASPFAVFRVGGEPGAAVDLVLTAGTATASTDYADSLEVFDPTTNSWVAYEPDTTTIDSDGVLLVRVALTNDDTFENQETFFLAATSNNATATGTATIVDDGTGLIFLTQEDNPATAEDDEFNLGVNDLSQPELDRFTPKDDDRALAISDLEVNEASPFAVFTVTAVEGQALLLDLASGKATIGQDTGATLEYFDGNAWQPYIPGQAITVPAAGTDAPNEAVSLLVRVPISQDINAEGPESFSLLASYANTGRTAAGSATILDDGTGNLFGPANTDGQPDQPGENGLAATLINDDDRPLEVNGTSVGEASPYIYWSVTGEAGQITTLDVSSGTGLVGVDTAPAAALQVFDGTNWVAYTAAVALPSSGELQVRLAVVPDLRVELSETLTLTASNTAGTGFSGESTILDEGPIIPADETPLSIVGTNVNEASEYLLYTISGAAGQTAKLTLTSDSGTAGTDTGSTLQYFNGTNWVDYNAGDSPALLATNGGPAELLVRVAVTNDSIAEGKETLILNATTAGGLTSTGIGSITDDGTGDIFLGTNTTNTPDDPNAQGYTGPALNNDTTNPSAPPSVSSFTVNEDSPYAVFRVGGAAEQAVTLTLNPGSASSGSDYINSLEVFDPTTNSWVAYASNNTKFGTDGLLLARVALKDDANFEGPETFSLTATSNNATATGTATIVDDGTGLIFLTQEDNPATAEDDEFNLGVNDLSQPELDRFTPKDDDRALAISDLEVNEASPFAVFTVTAVEGQALLLDLASGSARLGDDTKSTLQYYNGTTWLNYTPGQAITVPSGGTSAPNEAIPLLVRVTINQDTRFEGPEDFFLSATYINNGRAATAKATILDNGTGNLYASTNSTGNPDSPGQNDLVSELDFDRGLIPTDDGQGLRMAGPKNATLWVDISAILSSAFLQNSYNLIRRRPKAEGGFTETPIGAIGGTPDSGFLGDTRIPLNGDDELRFVLKSNNRTLVSTPDIKITGTYDYFTVELDDSGLTVQNDDYNDLVLHVSASETNPRPLNTAMAGLQTSLEQAYLDLRTITANTTLAVDVQTDSSARDAIRLVKLHPDKDFNPDGTPKGTVAGVAPTAGRAFDTAVRSNLLPFTHTRTSAGISNLSLTLTPAQAGVYAPVLITPTGAVYTFGSQSSSDRQQHVKVLGANSFGFENQSGSFADWDFNDLVVSFKLTETTPTPRLALASGGRGLTVVGGGGDPNDATSGLWLDLSAVVARTSWQNNLDLFKRSGTTLTPVGSIGATANAGAPATGGLNGSSTQLFLKAGETLEFRENSNDNPVGNNPLLRISQLGERFIVALDDRSGPRGSSDGDFNDLIVQVDSSPLPPEPALSALSTFQRTSADGVLDLTNIGPDGVTLELAITSDSQNRNTLRFVKLDPGADQDPLTGLTVAGVPFTGSNSSPFLAAVNANLTGPSVTLGGKASSTISWSLDGLDQGFYAPVLITPTNQVFTLGDTTSSDRRQHLKLLGTNTFGFEELLASQRGVDFDYNDLIVRVTQVTQNPPG